MPPLPGLSTTSSPLLVPVVGIQSKRDKGKAPLRHPPRREYGDAPLPVRPNTTAPKNARIVDRKQEFDGGLVSYRLKIGEVEVNDVGVDEILEYVSALELEQFERRKFGEEGEILKALEQEQEAHRKAKLARAAEKARNRGAIFVEEGSESDGLGGITESGNLTLEVQVGRHGRARPDYSKFYKPPRGKGKKVFEDIEMADASDELDEGQPSASRPSAQENVSHRRRRKRDPITGELMPLEPPARPRTEPESDKKVRRRRKRHPLTGELMPLGWVYDPEAAKCSYEKRRIGLGSAMNEPSFQRVSISDQHPAKRARLDTECAASSSASPVPTKAEIMSQAVSQSTLRGGLKGMDVVDLMSSDDEPNVVMSTPKASLKSPARQAGNSMMRGTVNLSASASANEEENSPEPEPAPTTSLTRPTAASPLTSQRTPKAHQSQLTTSVTSPFAAPASYGKASERESEPEEEPGDGSDDSSDDEAGEDEWFIESILGHRISDPKSHPPELGKRPVMLYSVKWEGYDKPTWEPMDSFGDRSFVDAYRKKVGLKPIPKDNADEEDEGAREAKRIQRAKTQTAASASKSRSKSSSRSVAESQDVGGQSTDEEEYVFEKILSHHLSDPRTHPKALGKTPVMLFEVKWKGFEETTWEPEESFEDNPVPLSGYKQRQGLR